MKINYYRVKEKKDYEFLADLFVPKNYRYIEKEKTSVSEIKKKKRFDYILTLAKEKIGWFAIISKEDKAEIGIILKKEYQGRGLGLVAMKLIEKEAAKLKYKKIFLKVLIKNKKAKRLYEKSGFKEKYREAVMEKVI
jgi:RimJ/RimL family protein N-acetyltransferase